MTDERGRIPHTFDGYLLHWNPTDSDLPPNSLRERIHENLLRIPGVKSAPLTIPQTWSIYSYESEAPLFSSDPGGENGRFHYYFVVRVNLQTGNVILGTSTKDASEGLIDHVLDKHFIPNFSRVQIRVADLANHFAEVNSLDSSDQPSSGLEELQEPQLDQLRRYKVTYISADVLDGGADIRSALFFGEDLGNTAFYMRNRASLSARQIGVREVATLKESARLGTDGYLRFYFRSGGGLQQLERCLFFVNDLNLYVHSD